ncbi:SdpI family protein [Halomarina oriensis]|uniref:DUF1648 domain-containing protein n=1 Tax=Halomarina oriensis TaxID=671145 RepID=A0A6B0GQD1_9EURY|nr:SdpI family protein [Halomarina oriensis]MWG36880.1 DUF1648 domain-containing protein [Halomarina oriensis]
MNTRQRFGIAAGLVGLTAAVSVLAAPALPEQLVTRWDAAGDPSGSMSKTTALALVPLLSAGLVALLAVLPRVDPLGENVETFRATYDWFVVLLAGFMLVIHVATVAANLGYAVDVTLVVLGCVAVLFYGVGVLLERVEPNWFVGVRTPWTLSDEAVWDRTHALAARLFKLTALVALVGLAFGEYALYFLLVPALLTAAITVGYSYVLYERRHDGTDGTESGL